MDFLGGTVHSWRLLEIPMFLGATRETSTFAAFFRHFSRSQSLTNVQRRSKRRQTIPLDPLDRHGWKPYHHVDGTHVG